ncbi:MAG: hypothetical protein J6Y28_08340 [Acholeplasmatales bacterium]|nr:hypothetical protein [Acholeplasmatales bacterium]
MRRNGLIKSFIIISLFSLALVSCKKKDSKTTKGTKTRDVTRTTNTTKRTSGVTRVTKDTTKRTTSDKQSTTESKPEPLINSNDCYVSNTLDGVILNAYIKDSQVETINMFVDNNGTYQYQIKPNVVDGKIKSAAVIYTADYDERVYAEEACRVINNADQYTPLQTFPKIHYINKIGPNDPESPCIDKVLGIKVLDDRIKILYGTVETEITIEGVTDDDLIACGADDIVLDDGSIWNFVDNTLTLEYGGLISEYIFDNNYVSWESVNQKNVFEHIDENTISFSCYAYDALDTNNTIYFENGVVSKTEYRSKDHGSLYTYTYGKRDDNETLSITHSEFSPDDVDFENPLESSMPRVDCVFDKYHRIIECEAYNSSNEKYILINTEYDVLGNVLVEELLHTDGAQEKYVYTYNSLNLLIENRFYGLNDGATDYALYELNTYGYDENNNLIKFTKGDGTKVNHRIEKIFDDETNQVAYEIADYTYDEIYLIKVQLKTYYETTLEYAERTTKYLYNSDLGKDIPKESSMVKKLINGDIKTATDTVEYFTVGQHAGKVSYRTYNEYDYDGTEYVEKLELIQANIGNDYLMTIYEYISDFEANVRKKPIRSIVKMQKIATDEVTSHSLIEYYFKEGTYEYDYQDCYTYTGTSLTQFEHNVFYGSGVNDYYRQIYETYAYSTEDGYDIVTKDKEVRASKDETVGKMTRTVTKTKENEIIASEYQFINGDYLLMQKTTTITDENDVTITEENITYDGTKITKIVKNTTKNGLLLSHYETSYDSSSRPVKDEAMIYVIINGESQMISSIEKDYDYSKNELATTTTYYETDEESSNFGKKVRREKTFTLIGSEEILRYSYTFYREKTEFVDREEIYDYDDRFGDGIYHIYKYMHEEFVLLDYEEIEISPTEKYKWIYEYETETEVRLIYIIKEKCIFFSDESTTYFRYAIYTVKNSLPHQILYRYVEHVDLDNNICYKEEEYRYTYIFDEDENGQLAYINYKFYNQDGSINYKKCYDEMYEYDDTDRHLFRITLTKYITDSYSYTSLVKEEAVLRFETEQKATILYTEYMYDEEIEDKISSVTQYLNLTGSYETYSLNPRYYSDYNSWFDAENYTYIERKEGQIVLEPKAIIGE